MRREEKATPDSGLERMESNVDQEIIRHSKLPGGCRR
jgi:hypothetical protein